MTWFIKGADLLGQGRTDIAIANGKIVAVGTDAEQPKGAEVIDADGLVALPGLVDIHTHLREPGGEEAETIESGSQCAAAGGFTAVLAMANTDPVTDTVQKAEWMYARGQRSAYADVFPVGAVTKGLEGKELAELGLMARSKAKVRFFSDDGRCIGNAQVMRRALDYVKAFDGVIAQHAQDPYLAPHPGACCHEGELSGRLGLMGWPGVAEDVIVARDVMLARMTGSRLHVCHVSTAGSVDVIRWAKSLGVPVTAEATPHHLLLTTDLVATYDSVYKVNPPLRPAEDVEALRAAVADGTIDAVATDHAPHPAHAKQHDFPLAAFGMLGLETAVPIIRDVMVRSGLMSWADVAQTMSVRPARIARLEGHGRSVAVGEPANIVLIDPEAEVVVDASVTHSRSRNNPYDGRTFKGRVMTTLLRGVPTVLEGRLQ